MVKVHQSMTSCLLETNRKVGHRHTSYFPLVNMQIAKPTDTSVVCGILYYVPKIVKCHQAINNRLLCYYGLIDGKLLP